MITLSPNFNNRYTPSFQAYQKTFVMLKPDSFERHLDGVIMNRIADSHLQVLKQWEGVAPRKKLEENYAAHKNKSFFHSWIDFLQSGKIRAMLVGGEDAIDVVNALKKSVRQELAPGEKRFNLIHSSDDAESANREIKNFFDTDA